jgi:hypothetical protein
MRHYCTLFDRNYLARGLALHRSLVRHGGEFTLHVLCLDKHTKSALSALALAGTELITLDTLEDWDRELRAVRPDRAPAEFYFTCKPVLLGYLQARHPHAQRITYLDSDLFFFSDAAAAEEEFAHSPVALSPHRFSAQNADRIRYGRFNAGWVSVDVSREARRFVGWWRERCIEWCRLAVEDTRFGDQKYLDQVPTLFPASAIIAGAVNLGPWNLDPSAVELSANRVMVSGRPLVVFHFHGIQRMLFGVYDCGLYEYRVALTPEIKEGIYRPYVQELAACSRQAAARSAVAGTPPRPVDLARRLKHTARALARHTAILATA